MWPFVRKSKNFRKFATQALSSSLGEPYHVKSGTQSPKPFSDIPGPAPVPFLGNSMELKKNYDRLQYYYHDCFEKYGSIFKLKTVGGFFFCL